MDSTPLPPKKMNEKFEKSRQRLQKMNENDWKTKLKQLTARSGLGASSVSCGTGTAMASEHSATAINAAHFHENVCILVYLFVIWINLQERNTNCT